MPVEVKSPLIKNAEIRLLERLCNACGISGNENEVRKIVLEEIKSAADEIKVDALGNVLATRTGTHPGKRLRVMLAAHMDEVGFMIVHDEGDGIFKFGTVGGLKADQLIGKPVVVGSSKVSGVIGAKPIHHTTASERRNPISIDALRIDTGPEAKNKVKLGDRATFAPNFTVLGSGANRSLRSKALDNRFGVATVILLLQHAPENIDLLAAFTVQEEIGLRGAKVAAHALNPDLAIAVDSTPAYDLPHWDNEDENTIYNTQLGKGPAIYISDSRTLGDPRLIRHFTETGNQAGIPYQIRQPGGGSTDAGAIHISQAGIPAISISVPGRYAHTAAGLARLSDWQNTLALLHAGLQNLSPSLLDTPRG